MMFGHENTTEDLIEFLLSQFDLEELLEMNDLSPEEVLLFLFEGGLIAEPEHIIERFEATE